MPVINNTALSRFELESDGAIAFVNYRISGENIIFTHTETPRALRGRGIATRLVEGAIALANADGLTVIPGCSFVADYMAKHPA
ncbi:MAG: acetyltransferase [Proteobacteria bacterium SG_bin9]|nr:MAG: acetyltransferase [Proteobacteria bacterium SG_bin9]